ncbi:hypothetical protein BPOR_0047g00040 [Botrytis porri]|uniref:Uncharacterized protein n=1 Tax=Botrytis porri TaxID=87229 RepID=A0A4Z1L279_9HELO|nr:hypothetical protein BPOR_0047g00040 [Botrytis porri]
MNTKITFLGDRNVGKTSMASRILQLDYLSIGSHPLYENIQEISTIDYLDELLKKSPDWAECLVMIYNIGSPSSFDLGAKLFACALRYRSPRVAIVVANVDDANERSVNREKIEQFMKGYKGFDWHFLETSIRDFQQVFQPPIQASFFFDHHYPFMRVVQSDGEVLDAEVTTQPSPDLEVINVETSLCWQILPKPVEPFHPQLVNISAEVLAEEDAVKPPTEQWWLRGLVETFVRENVDANWHYPVGSSKDEKSPEAPTMKKGVDEDFVGPLPAPHAFQIISYDYIEHLSEAKGPRSKISLESTVEVSTDMKELKSCVLSNTKLDSAQESYLSEDTGLENTDGHPRIKLRWLRDLLCCLQ